MYIECEICGQPYKTKQFEVDRYKHHYCSKACYSKKYAIEYEIKFAERNTTFKLVDYSGKNSVTIECKECGDRIETDSTQAMRRTKCFVCIRNRAEEKAKAIAEEKLKRKQARADLRAKKDRLEKLTRQLERNYQRRLNAEKTKEKEKARYKYKELVREKRIRNNGRVDKGITLKKLFQRDKGICYLCGKECNYNDYHWNDRGAFIVGKFYPSIDHVVPLSLGGTHTWDNIKLAHISCNSKKKDSPGGT
jgi:5-methylcytosine-specific restriction endonuclease McrA